MCCEEEKDVLCRKGRATGMEVREKEERRRRKRRWLESVMDDISERRDCRGRKCTTELHSSVRRHIDNTSKWNSDDWEEEEEVSGNSRRQLRDLMLSSHQFNHSFFIKSDQLVNVGVRKRKREYKNYIALLLY